MLRIKLLACISLLFFFISCTNKHDPSVPMTPSQSCRIATAAYIAGAVRTTYTFTYDDSGRIIKTVYDAPDAYTKTYTYQGNMIYMNIEAGVNSSTDTIALNNNGLIATHKETTPQAVYNTSYTYNASGILISSTSRQDNFPSSTITYNFINGDLTNLTADGLTDTTTYYTDKTAVIGNLDDLNQMIYYGSFYYKNKHLKKSYQFSPSHFDYSYTFDNDGKITAAFSTNGTNTDTTNFTYVCH